MTKSRPPYQLELALPRPGRGEAPRLDRQEVEAVTATAEPESPASTEHLMEAICAPDNIEAALRAVVRNKGAPGIDGITVKQLPGILKARWSEIEDQLLQGRYQPQPVRRVKIPKPAGGTRNLGIPTVIDRAIQQAVLQRLQPQWDPTFSEHSYGFRPGRSAPQAVALAIGLRLPGLRGHASQLRQDPRALPVYRLSTADILDRRNDFRRDQSATVYLVSRHVPPHPEQGRHFQYRVGPPAWRHPDHGLEDQAQAHAGDDGTGRHKAPDRTDRGGRRPIQRRA